jgi:putative tributyrin esterase
MSPYRNYEVSDPEFECEHIRTITIGSGALKMRGDISLFVPPVREAPHKAPLLILLHGVFGGHWAWTMKGGVHRCALRLMSEHKLRQLAIAMPSDGLWADGSGYLAHHDADFERWIMEDVIEACQETTSLVDDASPLFLSGLSMGGYGALRLGAKYAERVCGISAHSSITNLEQMRLFVREPPSAYADPSDQNADVLFWLRENRESLPPIRFDCGDEDLLVNENRLLHTRMVAEGIVHSYEEYPGGHDWVYWRKHIQKTLLFVESTLGARESR